jgi:short-subunit dehydrogenase
MHLTGRRVLVTGGSRGIGAAALDTAAAEVGATPYAADLSELSRLPELVERVEADGPIDVLVNNAGVANVGWYLDRTPAEIDQVMTVNLLAPMHLCRLWLPLMVERRRGHVVNLSSMAGVFAPPGLTTYGASKAGLSHFTAGLRADLRDEPIGFTTVHLGSVSTEMDDEARSYGPLRQLTSQSKGRDLTPMATLVDAIIEAVEQDRPEVRVPRAMAPLAAATNLPRKVGRLMFKRAMAYEPRS